MPHSKLFKMIFRTPLVLLCVSISLSHSLAVSQEVSTPSSIQLPSTATHELWYGVVEDSQRHFRNVFSWRKGDSSSRDGKVLALDENLKQLDLTVAEASEYSLTIKIPEIDAQFVGSLLDQEHAIGQWKQKDKTIPMRLERIQALPKESAQLILRGSLDDGGEQADFTFRFFGLSIDGEKTRSSKGYLETKGKGGFLCQFQEMNGMARIDIPSWNAMIEGNLSPESKTLKGTYRQASIALPIEFSVEMGSPSEPIQETKASSPQSEALTTAETRTITEASSNTEAQDSKVTSQGNGSSDREIEVKRKDSSDLGQEISLAGTLSLPEGEGAFPLAILVSGIGPHDRDATLGKQKPFLWMRDFLVSQGYAVLRYDDRGVGKSTGTRTTATIDDFAKDLESIVDFAKTQKGIDPNKIVLIGHSEGGMIAGMVADWNPSIAAIVLLATPGVTGTKLIESQAELLAKFEGEPKAFREAELKLRKEVHRLATNGIWSQDPLESVKRIVAKHWEQLRPPRAKEASKEQIDDWNEQDRKDIETTTEAFAPLFTPWFQRFLSYDPSHSYMGLRQPILALWGELDTQVSAEENMEALHAAVKRSGNGDATLAIIPGVNHLMQNAMSGLPKEYDSLRSAFDDQLLPLIVEWLDQHLQESNPPSP